MPQQKHNSEQLKAYREAAVELREFSLGVKGKIEEAAETGELQDAKAALSELQARTKEFTKLRICGYVKDSTGKNRAEQEELVGKENIASLEDLAVPFAVHWIATGEPLIGWLPKTRACSYVVRAVGGALYFYGQDLEEHGVGDRNRISDVAVAARLSTRSISGN